MDSPVKLHGPNGAIAHHVYWATSFRARHRGVLGREPLAPDEAMVLKPCHQVHTRGVPYPLDAVFCGRGDRVLRVETLEPGRVSRYVWRARYCVELLGGRADECGVVRGTTLSFTEAP